MNEQKYRLRSYMLYDYKLRRSAGDSHHILYPVIGSNVHHCVSTSGGYGVLKTEMNALKTKNMGNVRKLWIKRHYRKPSSQILLKLHKNLLTNVAAIIILLLMTYTRLGSPTGAENWYRMNSTIQIRQHESPRSKFSFVVLKRFIQLHTYI